MKYRDFLVVFGILCLLAMQLKMLDGERARRYGAELMIEKASKLDGISH